LNRRMIEDNLRKIVNGNDLKYNKLCEKLVILY
jgi:hypothetical protein